MSHCATTRRVAAVALACGLMSSAAALPQEPPPLPAPEEIVVPDPAAFLAALPSSFHLRGQVIDQFDQPAAGVTIAVAGTGNRATSDSVGRFALPEEVKPADRVQVVGEDFVSRLLLAGSLWAGHEGVPGDSSITIARLTTTFEVGPEGGTHRGEVTFEVPPNAVAEPVRLRAALLPRKLAWATGQGLHPQPLAAVHLEPAGLKLARPIQVRLPLPADADLAATPALELYDPESESYGPAADASVAVEDGELVLTVSHFSRNLTVDPSRGVERRLVARTWDVNGDGRLSAEDADLVVVLRGGTHEASWAVATTVASTVFRTTGRAVETSEEETLSASAGVSFGGVGVSISGETSREESRQLLETLGMSATTERSTTQRIDPIQAPEYERRCLYLLRIYNYWEVTTWKRIELSAGALARFLLPADGRWHYYRHQGDSIAISDRTLPAGRYALRQEGNRAEAYLQTDRFVVREPSGTTNYACSTELPVEPRDLWRGGDELGEARFVPAGRGWVSVEYGGWGVLPGTVPVVHRNIECQRPGVRREETVRAGFEETSDKERIASTRRRAVRSASVSAELPLTGGLGVSGGVAWEHARSTARSVSTAYGTQLVRQQETTIAYGIASAHPHHLSDHRVYKLHLLHTTRYWAPLERSEVPEGLRRIPTTGWRWFGDRAFAHLGGDAFVMRDRDAWWTAGPPVTTAKEVGLYLARVAERFCGPQRGSTVTTPSEAPRPPVTTPSSRPVETPSGREDEEEQAPQEQSALPPAGSRAVLTGTVIAGEPATLTAVDPEGRVLTGVVVEIGEDRYTTGERGRVVFTPPSGSDRLIAVITDTAGGRNQTPTDVAPRPEGFDPSQPPVVDEAPRYPTPGDQVTVNGGPFAGDARGNTVTLDGEPVPVLASSPTEVVVATDPSTSLGEHRLVVTTAAGSSSPTILTFLRMRLEATARNLLRGQRATARILFEGTRKRLCVRVTNRTPGVISLRGGETVVVTTDGRAENVASLRFTGVGAGDFAIHAEVLGERGEPVCRR